MKSVLRHLRSIATHPKCSIKPSGKGVVGFGMKSRSQDAEGFIQPSAIMASRKHRTQLYRFLSTLSIRAGKLVLLPLLGTAVYNISTPLAAHALTSGVTITSITPFAALDSNNSCAAGPRAMYLQVNVQNTTTAPLTGLSANINTFSNNVFTLDSGESPVRYIGSLAAGQTTALYWYVNYPCQSVKFSLGPTTNYTVTLSDSNPGTVTSSTLTLTTRSEISANAGGDILKALIGAGAVPGQIIPYTVNYSFGNPAANATVMIQPAGNVSFDSSCYRLIDTNITASNFTAGPTTTNNNRLYFTGVAGGSSNALTAVYSFLSLCTSAGTVAKPFADQTSGSDQKYTGNYETFIGPTFPTSTNPFTITKSVSSAALPTGGSVTYTVTVSNPSLYSAVLDRITDILPTGVTYGALVTGTGNTSDTITNGSSSQPAAGATGTISWVGNPSTSFILPAGGSITLKYTATVPNVVGLYPNSVTATAGSSTTAPATVTVIVGTLISGTIFEDPNYGGGAGRPLSTATTSPRGGATVELYKNDGTYIRNTLTSSAAGSVGQYTFGITAGDYLVRVVNSTLISSRLNPAGTTGLLPVQTFRTNASTGTVIADLDRVGGEVPNEVDAAANTTSLTLSAINAVTGQEAQSISPVKAGTGAITGIDFGYNFDTIVNTNNSGQGSLRQFITNSNALTGNSALAQSGRSAGKETSIFMISNGTAGSGLRSTLDYTTGGIATINLTSAGTTITDNDTAVDGSTQPLASCTTRTLPIQVSGPTLPDGNNLFGISGNNAIVKGMTLNMNTGLAAAYGNLFAIKIDPSSSGNTVQCNNIGSNPTGTALVGRMGAGINILGSTNLIGGTTTAARNLVVGNGKGIDLSGNSAASNTIQGNYIGTNIAGTAVLGQISSGIRLVGAGTNNLIGGTATGAGNLISGNTAEAGIEVRTTANTTIQGNLIGTTANGLSPLGNTTGSGISFYTATNSLVGGSAAGARNIVSGNVNGITLASTSTNINIQGNYIGTDINGANDLGNGTGIYIDSSSTNSIGGTIAGEGNIIANSTTKGLIINSGTGNSIRANSIFNNKFLGIDLDNNLVSPNDGSMGTGANNGMDYPVITSSTLAGNTLTVKGYVGNNTTLSNTQFSLANLEFFIADNTDGNQDGEVLLGDGRSKPHGEGKTYIGTCNTLVNSSFTCSFNNTTTVGLDPSNITSTATLGNSTSEFSATPYKPANVLFVKRITAINGTNYTGFVDDTYSTTKTNDNSCNWPGAVGTGSCTNPYLAGETGKTTSLKVKPGDVIEYTVYYLNQGENAAKSIKLCDRLDANLTFNENTYASGKGVRLVLGNGTTTDLTNLNDTADQGQFLTTNPLAAADKISCNLSDTSNPSGTISIDLTGNLPGVLSSTSTNPATYGKFTFKATIK